MKEHLWDGNIDCGWEDLGNRVVDTSNKFASDMLEKVSYSPYDLTKELITKETMDRFSSIRLEVYCEDLIVYKLVDKYLMTKERKQQ